VHRNAARHRDTAVVSITRHGARLSTTSTPPAPTSAVLVLHGGSVDSSMRVGPLSVAALRLVPVARTVARMVPDAAVHRLRFSIRGWNTDGAAVLRDARWAVVEITRRHPGLPVVLVGHSLGGRVAMQTVRTERAAVGAVGLAPWLVADDAVDGLADVPLFVVQGTRDRTIPEPSTRAWLARAVRAGARVESVLIERGGHPMLRYARRWHRLAADGVLSVLAAAERPTTPEPGMMPP
jgi:pimeloyl-ACP methyl ester carboxylesterase